MRFFVTVLFFWTSFYSFSRELVTEVDVYISDDYSGIPSILVTSKYSTSAGVSMKPIRNKISSHNFTSSERPLSVIYGGKFDDVVKLSVELYNRSDTGQMSLIFYRDFKPSTDCDYKTDSNGRVSVVCVLD